MQAVTDAVPDEPINQAKEFANRAKSSAKSNLPVSRSTAFDSSLLQKNVSQQLQQKASATAKQAGAKVRACFLESEAGLDDFHLIGVS